MGHDPQTVWDDRIVPQPEPTAPPGEPLGRDAELAALRTFLDGAGGAPVVATVEGDAGMGKSTLVRWTLDTARGRGWTVLSARPAETEVSLSWVVVSDLLGPVFDRVANALPEPQARALEAVLLRTEAGPTEPRLAPTAIVSVPGALAIEDRPVNLNSQSTKS